MDKHYCKAARDCGCTIWDYGKVSPICAETHCMDYVLPEPITNADRIRAMSDEELAKFLEQVGDGGTCSVCGNIFRCRRNNAPEPVYNRHIKDWLQQPAQEEGQNG